MTIMFFCCALLTMMIALLLVENPTTSIISLIVTILFLGMFAFSFRVNSSLDENVKRHVNIDNTSEMEIFVIAKQKKANGITSY